MECLPISVRPTSLSPLLNTSLYAVNRPARLANWLSVLHIWRACSSNGRTEVDICSHGHDRLPEVHSWPGHLTPLSGLLLLLLVTLQTQSFPTTLAVFNSFLGGPTITRIFISQVQGLSQKLQWFSPLQYPRSYQSQGSHSLPWVACFTVFKVVLCLHCFEDEPLATMSGSAWISEWYSLFGGGIATFKYSAFLLTALFLAFVIDFAGWFLEMIVASNFFWILLLAVLLVFFLCINRSRDSSSAAFCPPVFLGRAFLSSCLVGSTRVET